MDDIRTTQKDRGPRPFVLPDTGGGGLPPVQTPRHRPRTRRLWPALMILGALILFGVGFVLYQGLALGERMQFSQVSPRSFVTSLQALSRAYLQDESLPLKGAEGGRINILLLGRAGEHYPGKNLTDTVMIMSLDLKDKRVALLSLPRDLYVPIGQSGFYTKLNSVYQYGLSNEEGVEPLRESITTITGLPIHYFFTLDFDGFEKVVDTLGGISVDVPRDMYDTRYPGKNYSYETFEIKRGWQTLDGATALKYVRERHADPEGDFGRAKRQQQVIQAIKNKTLSLGTLFNIVTLHRLVDTLGDSIKTDMPTEDMTRFFELAKSLDTQNINTTVIDAWKKDSLLRVSHVQVGAVSAFILVPRVGNWSEITDVSRNIFDRDALEKRKQAIRAEAPTLTLYAKPIDREVTAKIATLLRDELGFSEVTLVTIPALNTDFEESIMVKESSRSALAKPFSLDELLKRFSPTEKATLPFTPTMPFQSDFALVIGTDLAEAFALPDTPTDLTPEDSSFSEPLPPQQRKK